MTECANCTSTEDVATVSVDIDVKAVALCQICRLFLVADLDEFERHGKRGRRERSVSPKG